MDASEDEALLQDVVDILLQSKSDSNESYYRNRLEESIRQAEASMLTPTLELHKMARQWIAK